MKNRERERFIRAELPLLFPPPKSPVSEELLQFGFRLVRGERLLPDEAARSMEIMIGGRSAPYEAALFLAAFELEESSPEELAAMARVMRARATRVTLRTRHDLLCDNCGTGGANLHLFNISTVAMFILAAAGVTIAKHGNRASTSSCGSADLLEAIGVRVDLGPEGVARCIERAGIGFIFAPRYHPAMKNVASVRKRLPFRTVFNILGPLCNPAPVTYQMIGVFDPGIQDLVARTLPLLGLGRALVVCGTSGGSGKWMDEVSTVGPTRALLVAGARSQEIVFEPRALGIARTSLDELRGGTPRDNARILKGVLYNFQSAAHRDICLINAAAGLFGAGIAGDLGEGMVMARKALESGAAGRKLEQLIEESNL